MHFIPFSVVYVFQISLRKKNWDTVTAWGRQEISHGKSHDRLSTAGLLRCRQEITWFCVTNSSGSSRDVIVTHMPWHSADLQADVCPWAQGHCPSVGRINICRGISEIWVNNWGAWPLDGVAFTPAVFLLVENSCLGRGFKKALATGWKACSASPQY